METFEDVNFNESYSDFTNFFSESYSHIFSEIDLLDSPDAHVYILLGESVANIHNAGIIHGDLHSNNIFYSSNDFRVTFIDYDTMQITDVNPRKMVIDFLPVYSETSYNQFCAFLVGYYRNAFIHIEPKYPGYIPEIINRMGGNAGRYSYKEIEFARTENGLKDMGITINLMGEVISAKINYEDIKTKKLKKSPLTILIIYLLGVVFEDGESENQFGVLANITERFFLKNPDLYDPWEIDPTFLTNVFLETVRKRLTDKAHDYDLVQDLLGVHNFLKKQYPQQKDKLLLEFISLSEFFAQVYCNDEKYSESNIAKSLSLAQNTLILLQSSSSDLYFNEIVLFSILRNHNALIWQSFKWEEDRFQVITHNFITYSLSKTATFRKLYSDSIKLSHETGSNCFQSLIIKAIVSCREMLPLSISLFKSKMPLDTTTTIVSIVMKSYVGSLKSFIELLLEKRNTMEYDFLTREFELAVKLTMELHEKKLNIFDNNDTYKQLRTIYNSKK